LQKTLTAELLKNISFATQGRRGNIGHVSYIETLEAINFRTMSFIKSLTTLVLLITTWTMTQAQDKEKLHNVWTFYEFEPLGKGGVMIGGMESFKLLEFKDNILLLKGNLEKIDSINYRVDGDVIVLFDKNKEIEANNKERIDIEIKELKADNLKLLFTLQSGETSRQFELKYRAKN
jgi:hypothetical protein